jgi:phosphate transport system substrate-binding protein
VPHPDSPEAYPIVSFSWLILYRQYKDPKKLDRLRDFVKYAVTEGQFDAEALGYIPLPRSVADKVKAAVDNFKLAANAD